MSEVNDVKKKDFRLFGFYLLFDNRVVFLILCFYGYSVNDEKFFPMTISICRDGDNVLKKG